MHPASADRDARVEAAVLQHAPAILAYFTRRIEHAPDAADLLADTFLVLWRRASSLPLRDDEVRPWMFGIARHVLMHHHRQTSRQRALADRLRAAVSTTPHEGFVELDEYDDLYRAIRALSPADRDIIGLIHWEGFSQAEVSRMLGVKESTVRSRYHRSRARLRELLERSDQAHARVDVADGLDRSVSAGHVQV